MKNFKISKKLTIAFGSITALLLVTAITAIIGLASVANNFTSFYTGPFDVTNKVMDMRRSIQAAAKYINYAFAVEDKAKTEEYINSAQDSLDELSEGIEFLTKNFEGEHTDIENFNNALNSGTQVREQIMELALQNRNDEASELFFNEYMPILVSANNSLTSIFNASDADADATYRAANTAKIGILILMVLIAGGAVAVTVVFALYIIKSLTAPIYEIDNAAKKMSHGDFEVVLTYQSDDELGSLSESMRQMVAYTDAVLKDTARGLKEVAGGNFNIAPEQEYLGIYEQLKISLQAIIVQLSGTMEKINNASSQVAGGSTQVADGSQVLSQGATEQASAVEELAATINEVTEKVRNGADDAKDASKIALEAGNNVETCNIQMQNMLQAMEEISGASQEINKIIGDIESIASQTNLLSLNAAIEAARAGEAGRGFAVVAEEVRTLAEESSQAVKNTAELITKAIGAVNKGTKIADETAETLKTVVTGAESVGNLVDKIADSAVSQAESLGQITQAIDQIAGVVQNNSATAEESAAASEELSAQSQILKDLVGKFKLLQMN